MTISELVDTIHALYLLPETEETREHRNALRKIVIKSVREPDNDDWLMMFLYQLMNYSPKGELK